MATLRANSDSLSLFHDDALVALLCVVIVTRRAIWLIRGRWLFGAGCLCVTRNARCCGCVVSAKRETSGHIVGAIHFLYANTQSLARRSRNVASNSHQKCALFMPFQVASCDLYILAALLLFHVAARALGENHQADKTAANS